MQEVADAIMSRFGARRAKVAAAPPSQHEARLLQLNCDKAHQLLAWHPRWSVAKTLDATAEWYKAVSDGASAEDVTRAQIQDYFPEMT